MTFHHGEKLTPEERDKARDGFGKWRHTPKAEEPPVYVRARMTVIVNADRSYVAVGGDDLSDEDCLKLALDEEHAEWDPEKPWIVHHVEALLRIPAPTEGDTVEGEVTE